MASQALACCASDFLQAVNVFSNLRATGEGTYGILTLLEVEP
jgi:hypothetical protein